MVGLLRNGRIRHKRLVKPWPDQKWHCSLVEKEYEAKPEIPGQIADVLRRAGLALV